MTDELPPYISVHDVRHVAEAITVLFDTEDGLTYEDLARAALVAYYAARSDLFKNPSLMSLVIASLTKRLGGKVKIQQHELDHAAQSALHSRMDETETPATLDLMLSSIITLPDEARTIQ
jgi:hypothetical protein|tara:strand:- start:1748 stop:2107 length:360 start_codon:yes stop_codon:yes gene_type:complete